MLNSHCQALGFFWESALDRGRQLGKSVIGASTICGELIEAQTLDKGLRSSLPGGTVELRGYEAFRLRVRSGASANVLLVKFQGISA